MAELSGLRTPEGRRAALDSYGEQLKARMSKSGLAEAEVSQKLTSLGVPLDAILGARNKQPTAASSSAVQFVGDQRALFLVLLGPKGVGKTSAAAKVVWDFVRQFPWNSLPGGSNQEPAMFVEAFRLTRLSAFETADKELVGAMNKAELLVLDDIGDEGSDFGKNVLADVLLYRHAKRRRTVLTGNITPAAFEKRYGPALWDRIRSTGIVAPVVAESLRRKFDMNTAGAKP